LAPSERDGSRSKPRIRSKTKKSTRNAMRSEPAAIDWNCKAPDQRGCVTFGTLQAAEVARQVPGLLGDPLAGGMSGDASDVQAAGAVFEEYQRIKPL
jgi:hypothetical protein